MSRFLITGLPRSRTAWFAVATGALHEPFSREGFSFFPKWADGGISDSGAGSVLGAIIHDFKPRTLVIDRPMGEVVISLRDYGVWFDGAEGLLGRLYQALQYDHPLIKRVAYDDLRDHRVMEGCMDWLGVKVPNLHQLMHMNIQSDLAWNLNLLRERAA